MRKLGRDMGFVPLVIASCVALYVATLIASGAQTTIGGGLMSLFAPSEEALFLFGASGAVPIFTFHAWWSVLSASWLHGSIIHILFNMMAVRNLAPTVAEIIGPSRTVVIYVISGVCGFLLSSLIGQYVHIPLPFLRGAGFITVGASASICGLLGALLHYGRVSGSSLIRDAAKQYAVGLVVIGLLMPGIDNFAHAGGFLGGYGISALFNPLKEERGDHTLMAIACLAASLLAVVFSFINGYSVIFG
jgi:rhomboid protease GluP